MFGAVNLAARWPDRLRAGHGTGLAALRFSRTPPPPSGLTSCRAGWAGAVLGRGGGPVDVRLIALAPGPFAGLVRARPPLIAAGAVAGPISA